MKHVFVINNGITELMAHRIIQELELPRDDCLLAYIARESFGTKEQIPTTIDTLFYDNGMIRNGWRRIHAEALRARSMVSNALKQSDYYCYTCSTRATLAQVLITADSCLGYYVVEEGVGAYLPQRPETPRALLRRHGRKALSLGTIECFGREIYCTSHKKYLGAFAATKSAFPQVAHVQVVGWPFRMEYGHQDIDALFVMPSASYAETALLHALKRFAADCWKGVFGEVAYKFHPNQSEDKCQRIRDKLREIGETYGIEFRELTDVVLENICYTRRSLLSVFFISSSVGFYAAMMGCRAVSLARYYSEHPEIVSEETASGLRRSLRILPPELTDGVEFL